jgi:hypothetical protein
MRLEELKYAMFGLHRGIVKGDIVFHQLSRLLFKCQNHQQERWMNLNPFYVRTELKEIDYEKLETIL